MLKRSRKKSKLTDLNQLARAIVDAATDECAPNQLSEKEPTKEPTHQKNPAAVALGKLGGEKGGPARRDKLSAERRKEIAQEAARARWQKQR